MTKAEKIEKMKAAGLDESTIAELMGDDSEVALLRAKITEAEGKASGILGDKKKYQARVDELQAKLDELEGKDLGEAGKLKLELERIKARAEKAEKDRAELESTYATERRNSELNKLAGKLKFLDVVPDDTRSLIVSNEFRDIGDLGNQVLVEERLKAISAKHKGLLAADVPNGAASKAGNVQRTSGTLPDIESIKAKPLSEIAKDPKAFVREVMAAAGVGQK